MALKLGELLLSEKMITEDQLDEALKIQMIYGIKLGSSLIEMGYIEEETLAHLLGSKLGVPYVGRKELEAVSRELIIKFPRHLVEAYHVVPLRLDGNRLSLAMIDPTDFLAIEEIGFVTGHVVKPYIAADVNISRALAKYYQIISREFRYQQLADQRRKSGIGEVIKPATMTMPIFTDTGELLNVTIPVEFEGFASVDGDEQEDLYMLSEEVSRYTIDRVSMDFAAAGTRDDVANIFIKYLGQEFGTAALFIVRANAVVGWRGVYGGEKVPDFEEFSLLLSKPSVLFDVITSRNFSMGTLVNLPENRQILNVLHLLSETSLLVLPVVMLNKVVALVLVTADMDALGFRLTELQKLVRKTSLAFEMLIIKNKILQT
jgi:hypothetical protein